MLVTSERVVFQRGQKLLVDSSSRARAARHRARVPRLHGLELRPAIKRVTVNLPAQLLADADEVSGVGITENSCWGSSSSRSASQSCQV
jgi:hypothetical protein